MIQIINIKAGIPDFTAAVYLGRQTLSRPASPLASPINIKHESERQEALQMYRNWLEEQMQADTQAGKEIERLAIISRRSDLLLLCWCAPKACHGDVVKKFVERIG